MVRLHRGIYRSEWFRQDNFPVLFVLNDTG